MKKVVVTGIGLATPLGVGKDKTWNRVKSGSSAVRRDCDFLNILSARIEDIDVPVQTRLLSLGFLSTAEAIHDSGLDLKEIDFERFGCTVSCSKPDINSDNPASFAFSNNYYPSTLGSQLYRIFKLKGPLRNICSACSTGTNSIIMGAEWIKNGICDYVIVGSAETSFHPLYVSGFNKMGVLAKNSVKPFDKKREGFAISEGAGVLVLESMDKAMLRGAKIYGEISGFGVSCDSKNPVSFDLSAEPVAKAIKDAVNKAGCSSIDYINAHGTGTILNDKIETKAIKNVFGETSRNISISSTKAATGHMLGASGAVEAAFCLLAMNQSIVPPTLNFYEPDPECDLDYTPLSSKHRMINEAMSISLGFGGQITAIIFKRP